MPSLKYLIAACFCVSLRVFLPLPALANDVIFPGGGGVGLKPPDGMTILKGPHGFEDSKEDAVIIIEEFDVTIYAPRASDFTAETWKDAATLEQITRFGRKGYVQTLCVFRPELDIVERCNEIGQSVMIKSNE